MSEPRNLLTVWSRLIASSLVDAGVRDVVISPGSRSTPFVLALREREELRLTSVIDERSAAFVALGMARAGGRAAAVLATSGTAPAHWYPAVIEASLSRVPLLLLSANRPVALAHTGAAQTIDQTKLFGSWARLFIDLGDPRSDEASLVGVVRAIGMAVARAHGPDAGPVHLDLHADKPLETVEATSDAERALEASARAVAARGTTRVTDGAAGPDEAFATTLAAALDRARRPLVIAGPRAASAERARVLDACAKLGVPVAAEATSQLRFGPRAVTAIDALEVLFASDRFARRHAPDLVVQIGSLPTAPTLERALRSVPRFVLEAGGNHDPIGGAAAISLGDAAATLERALTLTTSRARDAAWIDALTRADAIAWSHVERTLSSDRGEGATIRAALGAAGHATIVVGNSLPIRTLDRFVPGGGRERAVLSQRGANGIDGLVSGAIGAAMVSAVPVLAIVGDVSFVHDIGALASAQRARASLVVLVIDNGGGRIFESLPIAGATDAMDLFTTPHGIDLGAVCRACGVACIETALASETARAIAGAMGKPGVTIVRAVVPPHEARETFAELVRATERATEEGAP